MKIIGVTGGICSGKTHFTDYVLSKKFPVIDADEIARQLLAENYQQSESPLLSKLVQEFGAEIIDHKGFLKRQKLREIIFSDQEQVESHKRFIDALIHPHVYHKIKQHIALIQHQSQPALIFISIPLLTESADFKDFDHIVVIDCAEEMQIKRCMQRDQSELSTLHNLLKSQAKREDRLKIADSILDNSTSLEHFYCQIDELLAKLLNKFPVKS